MAKNSVRDFDATAANNTDIQSVDIAENCAPSGINNAIRELMADIKDVSAGTIALESPQADSLTVTGDLTVDTNTLFVDSTNNNVGIGTNSPASSISGSATVLQINDSNVASIALNNTGASTKFEVASVASDALIFSDNGTERMRIDSSGNLLVGQTTADSNAVGIGALPYGSLYSTRDGGSSLLLNRKTSDGDIAVFQKDGSTVGSIGTQNWLIGTTTAGISNSISTSIEASGLNNSRISVNHSSTGSSNGSLFMGFGYGGSTIGSITQASTSSVAYNTSSDYRLKENVTDIADGITRLKLLNPSRFNFIANADTTVDGFLAHEVSDVVPEAITGEKDAMMDEEYIATPATGEIYTPAQEATFDEDGNELTAAVDEVVHSTDVEQPDTLEEGRYWRETTEAVMATRSVPNYQGIDQSKLVPLLTAALQEAVAMIEALETRVAALEA